MNGRKTIRLMILLALALCAGVALAGDFVSFKGQFSVHYPDNWKQIDYFSADYHLSRAGVTELNYEAVLADSTYEPFYSGPYVIINVDSFLVEDLSLQDSLVREYQLQFVRRVKFVSPEHLFDTIHMDSMAVCKENGSLVIISKPLHAEEGVNRRSVLASKLYPGGVADFYFYCPDSVLEASLPVFASIFNSFSQEDLQTKLTSEPVKVSDAKPRSGGDEGVPTSYLFGSVGGLFVIFIVLMAARKKKRGRQKKEE